MFYTVYKITNMINGKYYIGKHQTKDLTDGYMGSGILIRRAITKHGVVNFKKEYLLITTTEEEMNEAEKHFVNTEDTQSYNLCPGGKGGFGYINKVGKNGPGFSEKRQLKNRQIGTDTFSKLMKTDQEFAKRFSEKQKEIAKIYPRPSFKNRNHTNETKRRIGEANRKMTQEKNSQFGTCWITNGIQNKKIMLEDIDKYPGYKRGRIRS